MWFDSSVRLPKNVDTDQVKAEVKNGLLTVSAPIAGEGKARKIQVQAA
jgi:HSP20 family molecular chaperone IbpA